MHDYVDSMHHQTAKKFVLYILNPYKLQLSNIKIVQRTIQ